MKLYNVAYSGNSYKVRLLLAQLGISCEFIEVDILKGERRTAEFLRINPNGARRGSTTTVFVLAESNAILAYLARGTKFLPDSETTGPLVFQWMFFEQYSHEPFIATSRFWLQHKNDSPQRDASLASKRDGGWAALKVMEEHLLRNDYFAGDYSIADIALFAYTHVSHEGGFTLDNDARIRAAPAREGAAGICSYGRPALSNRNRERSARRRSSSLTEGVKDPHIGLRPVTEHALSSWTRITKTVPTSQGSFPRNKSSLYGLRSR